MPELSDADLAPGDRNSMERDWSALELHRIQDVKSPAFQRAYRYLWEEFGRKNEIEQFEVLQNRLGWSATQPVAGFAMSYEMVMLTAHGNFAAARDHTVIVNLNRSPAVVTVHLSHVLVHPIWRRTGLAGRLRAIPIQAVRRVLKELELPADLPITLIAEMEPPIPSAPDRMVRLSAYEKAGFRKADPALTPYVQPDFRPCNEIDQSGGPEPIPFALILRRVGIEDIHSIPSGELKDAIRALYTMFGREFRERDMTPVWQTLEHYPPDDISIPLVPPTLVA